MKPQLTIEAFADWCEKQPADKRYNYENSSECAVAQYLTHLGAVKVKLWSHEVEAAFGNVVDESPWTFGALAARLRAAQ